MPRLVAAAFAAITLSVSTPAVGADILHACAGDIAQYCSAVEAGHGRIASCLYSHETVISDACLLATEDVGDFLDAMFNGLRVVYEACGTDISSQCSEVPAGEGRILSCLAESRDTLSDTCTPVIEQFTLMLEADAPQQQ